MRHDRQDAGERRQGAGAPEENDAPAVTVTEYTPADYDAVYGLWERGDLWLRPSDGRDQVALKLTRDPDLFLVARAGDRVVGSVMGGWDGRRAYVYHLAVEPARRRHGVGGALMDELEARLRRKGALKVKLQVLCGNAVSERFFQARGYEVETTCIPYGKELRAGGAPRERSPGAVASGARSPGAAPASGQDIQGDVTT
jgi:ribosomal protein S18 acetylase RimI-like enzyme